jgi:hypothetical protein
MSCWMLFLDVFAESTVVELGECRGIDLSECTRITLMTAGAMLHREFCGDSSQRTARVKSVQSAGREE